MYRPRILNIMVVRFHSPIIVHTFKSSRGAVKMSLCVGHSVNMKTTIPVSVIAICKTKVSKEFSFMLFIFLILEPEKNFALESYGVNSKCFDHTDAMWEERSCRQTREWQHWGSGCYKYECTKGRLVILVSYHCHDQITNKQFIE